MKRDEAIGIGRRMIAWFMPRGRHEKSTVFGDPTYWKGGVPTAEELDAALITILRHAQFGMPVATRTTLHKGRHQGMERIR